MNKEKLEKVIKEAIYYLSSPHTILPPRPAIVFDIDGTLIDENGKGIIPVIALFKFSKSMGITPFIITSRIDDNKGIVEDYTYSQLYSNDITGYASLFMLPKNFSQPWKYKLHARKQIHNWGFQVVMSIGDNHWDIGEYGGIGILV
jgi:predicted secreted acid phosphatase